MNCQNCEAPVPDAAERCEKCGAKLLHRRVVFGTAKADDFRLIAEEPASENDETAKDDQWQFSASAGLAASSQPVSAAAAPIGPICWGGFWRRAGAMIIDFVVLLLLSALMALMVTIGYKVGLAAHGRLISWDNVTPLVGVLSCGWVMLMGSYFVLFHGMEGKTVGKWLFRLRVVDATRQTIGYRQALVRCLGSVGFGLASFGLSMFWVLWSREKRGWHDFLARTWVIQD